MKPNKSTKSNMVFGGLKIFTYIVLVFFIWKILLNIVLIPVPTYMTNLILNQLFSSQFDNVKYMKEQQQLTVRMTLFKANRQWPNNSYAPELNVDGHTAIEIKNFQSYTLGLPLLWLLCMLVAKKKVLVFVIGTNIMLLIVSLVACLNVVHKLSIINADSSLLRYQDGGYIKVPYQYPIWLSDVLKPIFDLATNSLLYVFPLIITYILCRKNIIALMKKDSTENLMESEDDAAECLNKKYLSE